MFALLALASCTSAPSDQGNGVATAAASSSGQPASGKHSVVGYPAWAAAVVPPYTSNITAASATTDEIYQIDTADSYETVLAWYKAHIKTTWPDRHSNETVGKVGHVAITLQKAGDPTQSDPTRTIIGLLEHR